MNKKCKLTNYYDKKLGSKVTTLKICDKLMLNHLYPDCFELIKWGRHEKVCPYCGEHIV